MVVSNFTKGEWYVNHTGPHWANPEIANHEICYSEAGECVVDHVYELADAHLIAAAPDMYVMLEDLSALMVVLDEQTHPEIEMDTVKYDIELLLSKARGEKE